jgi:hypothetical protein
MPTTSRDTKSVEVRGSPEIDQPSADLRLMPRLCFMRRLAILVLLTAARYGNACFWDRDTLVTEAKGFPDVLQAIVGRFDRNPDHFYSMRLERVAKEIAIHPGQLDLYDDAGVAASHLGHQDQAIDWMERKRKASSAASADQRYRTESNEGTFELLAWMNDPKRSDHRKQLEQGIAYIEAGLKINPHAHFDREVYQLAFMKWLDKGGAEKRLADFMPFNGFGDASSEPARQAQIRGITGLIVLGSAWESPDLLNMLSTTLGKPHAAPSMAYMALLRARELTKAGKPSFGGDETPIFSTLVDTDRPYVESQFHSLRSEADAWQARRAEFMKGQFALGKHPDTDPQFWAGWKDEGPKPPEPMGWWQRHMVSSNANFAVPMIAFMVTLTVSVLVVYTLLKKLWRRYRPGATRG